MSKIMAELLLLLLCFLVFQPTDHFMCLALAKREVGQEMLRVWNTDCVDTVSVMLRAVVLQELSFRMLSLWACSIQ